jgi:hypothetical protein
MFTAFLCIVAVATVVASGVITTRYMAEIDAA